MEEKPWSEIILEFRRRLKLSQEQFAVYIGSSKATIVRWEKGISKPKLLVYKHIMELAKEKRDYKTSNLIQKIIEKASIPKSSLAEKILQMRLRLRLSQEELAEKIGINPRTVKRWEQGVCSPSTLIGHIVLEKFNNPPEPSHHIHPVI